jgi:hypothetical protein
LVSGVMRRAMITRVGERADWSSEGRDRRADLELEFGVAKEIGRVLARRWPG